MENEVLIKNGSILLGLIAVVVLVKVIALVIGIHLHNLRIKTKLGERAYEWLTKE